MINMQNNKKQDHNKASNLPLSCPEKINKDEVLPNHRQTAFLYEYGVAIPLVTLAGLPVQMQKAGCD